MFLHYAHIMITKFGDNIFVKRSIPTVCFAHLGINPLTYEFFLIQKKIPQAGFEPGTPTTNPEHTQALDRLAMAPLHWRILSQNSITI